MQKTQKPHKNKKKNKTCFGLGEPSVLCARARIRPRVCARRDVENKSGARPRRVPPDVTFWLDFWNGPSCCRSRSSERLHPSPSSSSFLHSRLLTASSLGGSTACWVKVWTGSTGGGGKRSVRRRDRSWLVRAVTTPTSSWIWRLDGNNEVSELNHHPPSALPRLAVVFVY